MATVSRGLPKQPHLDVPKREARELLQAWKAGEAEAFDRIRSRHPKFRAHDDTTLAAAEFKLSDAQLVLAREYGFSTWSELKHRIEANSAAHALDRAIRNGAREEVVRILRETPSLLHLPVRSGNWGPPMSHAANLGQLEIVQTIAGLGAKDLQHAFDRALLQGEIECARWLHTQGAQLAPGIVMGSCETLNPDGLRFLAELNAPFTDQHGDRMAPLSLVLETYGRYPKGKHQVLDIFSERGYVFPDTPIVAFHRGDTARLRHHLQQDPGLVRRRFAVEEIYPPALGCKGVGHSGMHWTPVQGTTLLHLAIDFQEAEIFRLLLEFGAEVNAPALVDSEGFGGHTALFHTVVNGPSSDGWDNSEIARILLARGASPKVRVNLRKFLDWEAEPRWHMARNVTPVEWGRTFPLKGWVDDKTVGLISEQGG